MWYLKLRIPLRKYPGTINKQVFGGGGSRTRVLIRDIQASTGLAAYCIVGMSLATRRAAHPYFGNILSHFVRKQSLTSLGCDGNPFPQGGGTGFRVLLFMQRERNCRNRQLIWLPNVRRSALHLQLIPRIVPVETGAPPDDPNR